MKKVKQGAQRNEKKNIFFFFANIEQFVSFLFFVIVVSLSVWIVVTVKNWVDDPERVVLSQLVLTGDNVFTEEEDIRNAILGLGLPNTYIAQDVDDIQQEIMRLPWIKQVSVRKQWPDRLIVHLEEYQPMYVWNDVFLLDPSGSIFNVPQDRLDRNGLPKLSGPIGKEKLILDTFNQLNAISVKLDNQNLTLSISEAIADDRNAWQLIVRLCVTGFCVDNQNIILKLGREKTLERYERFVHFFTDIQRNLPKDEKLVEVDLRYENGISVKKQKIENN